MQKFIVTYIEKNASEDDFEKGVSSKSTTTFSKNNLGTFTTLKAMFRELSNFGFPEAQKDYGVIDDGRITAVGQENAEGHEASSQEKEAWKKGETKLWVVDYDVYIERITVEELSVDDLHKLGFETV